MAIVQYGNWIIDVDLDKTKAYYQTYPCPEQNQIYMNYKQYCASMPSEEGFFFDRFGIDPLCCQPETIGMTKERTVPISAYFYVAGSYKTTSQETIIPLEEMTQNISLDDYEDPRINIGLFQFDFQNPDAVFNSIPSDIPDGFICINVWIEALPWLLNEDCEVKMYYPAKWWQFSKRIKEARTSKALQLEYENEVKSELESDFTNNNIPYKQLHPQETKQLFINWMEHFIPDASKRQIRKFAIHGNRKYSNYLWHAFSFDVLTTESVADAPLCYSNVKKKQCFLLLNNEQIAYVIEDATHLDVSILNKYNDILILNSDFTWTYCHTHEAYCGPYFHNKENPPRF